MIVSSLLWDSNSHSQPFSRMYDESWVEKLYRGFRRNITADFRFVLFTNRHRCFQEPIEQIVIEDLGSRGYSDCIRPYSLNEPMILVGLDTVVTGNVDHLVDRCLKADRIALPADTFNHTRVPNNGVALVPRGWRRVFDEHRCENDMDHMRRYPYDLIDDLWPGHVVSYKATARDEGLGDSRIVYFHGDEKPHQLSQVGWVQDHWI